jgi:SAM-dependent methyltransferase
MERDYGTLMDMANPFVTDSMAAGYATSRPPVHVRVMEQAYRELGRHEPFQRALDVGCGAGVSTRALAGFGRECMGLEPAEAMLQWAPAIAPTASFVVGAAEAIPLRDRACDLITAAGSLNYADLELFFPEAARVLTRYGTLLVYDFSAGRSFANNTGLDEWFAAFSDRYPAPAHEARELSPEILAARCPGFRVECHRRFEIAITLTPEFYLDYILTETNIAAAVRRGVPQPEIRSWCADTLAPLWLGWAREVLFRGYFCCLTAV